MWKCDRQNKENGNCCYGEETQEEWQGERKQFMEGRSGKVGGRTVKEREKHKHKQNK